MPFIAAEELPKMELFPGALSGIVAGEGLMLSFLEMAEGSEVPEHSHPHEQAGWCCQESCSLESVQRRRF